MEFTSTVTYVQNQPVHGITTTVGAPVSGPFTYDLAAVDTDPAQSHLGISFGGCWAMTLDGRTVTGEMPQWVVHEINAPNDLFGMTDGQDQTGSPLVVDGIPRDNGWVSFSFTEQSGTVLTSDALPTAAREWPRQRRYSYLSRMTR